MQSGAASVRMGKPLSGIYLTLLELPDHIKRLTMLNQNFLARFAATLGQSEARHLIRAISTLSLYRHLLLRWETSSKFVPIAIAPTKALAGPC